MAIIEQQPAAQPDTPVTETDQCNTCTYTEASVEAKGEDGKPTEFETKKDCRAAYLLKPATGDSERIALIKEAWKKAFADFKCKNKKCKLPEACDDVVMYIKAETVAKGANFKLKVTVGRNIRCRADSSKGDNDPDIPKYDPWKGADKL